MKRQKSPKNGLTVAKKGGKLRELATVYILVNNNNNAATTDGSLI